jgi:hypothetical protein
MLQLLAGRGKQRDHTAVIGASQTVFRRARASIARDRS